MFVYKCAFNTDNGYYVSKIEEVVISPRVVNKDEILQLLYEKYNDYDTVIENLLVIPMACVGGKPQIV